MSDNIYGTGIFQDYATNYGDLSAATFTGSAVNYGVIENGIFLDQATNSGIIVNDAVFAGTALNEGTVQGNSLFIDYSVNTGTVEGNVQKASTATVPTETVNGSIEQYNQPDGPSVYGYYDNGTKIGPINYETVVYEVSGLWYKYDENGNSSLAYGVYQDGTTSQYYFEQGIKTNVVARAYPYPTFLGERADPTNTGFFNIKAWRNTNGMQVASVPDLSSTIIIQRHFDNIGGLSFTGTVFVSGEFTAQILYGLHGNSYNNLYIDSNSINHVSIIGATITTLYLRGNDNTAFGPGTESLVNLDTTIIQNPIRRDISHLPAFLFDAFLHDTIVVYNDIPYTGGVPEVNQYYIDGILTNLTLSGNSILHDAVLADTNNDGFPDAITTAAYYETYNGFFYQSGQRFTGSVNYVSDVVLLYEDPYAPTTVTGYALQYSSFKFVDGYRIDSSVSVELSGSTYVYTGDIVVNENVSSVSSFILPRNSHLRGNLSLQSSILTTYQLPETVSGNVTINTAASSCVGMPSVVGGNVTLQGSNLTSLVGMPSAVGENITLSNTYINTLTTLPPNINGSLVLVENNYLTVMELPSYIGGTLSISNQTPNVSSFNIIGAPSTIGGNIGISDTASGFVRRSYDFEDITLIGDFYKIGQSNDKIEQLTVNSSRIYGNVYLQVNALSSLNFNSTYCHGLVTVGNNQLTNLTNSPLMSGTLDCSYNMLTSLEGAPETLKGFTCSNNKLSSLEGGPSVISASGWNGYLAGVYNCANNDLITLEGSPSTVAWFACTSNELSSLEGGPTEEVGTYEAQFNKLVTLSGAPMTVGNFNCTYNLLSSLQGGPRVVNGIMDVRHNANLTTLNYAPSSFGDFPLNSLRLEWVAGTNIPEVDDMNLSYDVAGVQWATSTGPEGGRPFRVSMDPPLVASWFTYAYRETEEVPCEDNAWENRLWVHTEGPMLTVGQRVHSRPFNSIRPGASGIRQPAASWVIWPQGQTVPTKFIYEGFIYHLTFNTYTYFDNITQVVYDAYISSIEECNPYYS